MYLGEKKVKGTLDNNDGTLTIGFKDNSQDIVLEKELFEAIKKDKKGDGTVADVIIHYFSVKFLYELSDRGMEFFMVENIAQGMKTLIHNMREDLIRKTFDCAGANDIPLKTLRKQYEDENK